MRPYAPQPLIGRLLEIVRGEKGASEGVLGRCWVPPETATAT